MESKRLKTSQPEHSQSDSTDSIEVEEEFIEEDLPLPMICPFCRASDDWFDPDKGECRYCGFF